MAVALHAARDEGDDGSQLHPTITVNSRASASCLEMDSLGLCERGKKKAASIQTASILDSFHIRLYHKVSSCVLQHVLLFAIWAFRLDRTTTRPNDHSGPTGPLGLQDFGLGPGDQHFAEAGTLASVRVGGRRTGRREPEGVTSESRASADWPSATSLRQG